MEWLEKISSQILAESRLRYKVLPSDADQPSEDWLQPHLQSLGTIVCRYDLGGRFGLHLLHSHFDLAPSEVVLGRQVVEPFSGWFAEPTTMETLTLDNVCPHNLCMSGGKIAPYEFRIGKWDELDIPAAFWEEITTYLAQMGLESVLGLQIIHDPQPGGIETAFSNCTVMLNSTCVAKQTSFITTGWVAQLVGNAGKEVVVLTPYEGHNIIDGTHKIFNEGAPRNVWEARDHLVRLGVLSVQ